MGRYRVADRHEGRVAETVAAAGAAECRCVGGGGDGGGDGGEYGDGDVPPPPPPHCTRIIRRSLEKESALALHVASTLVIPGFIVRPTNRNATRIIRSVNILGFLKTFSSFG